MQLFLPRSSAKDKKGQPRSTVPLFALLLGSHFKKKKKKMNGQRGKQGTQSRQQAQNPSHLLHLVAGREVKWGGGGVKKEKEIKKS